MMVDVEVLKGDAKGRLLNIGDLQAKALAQVGFLRIIKADEDAEVQVAKPKRTYQRKDMTAEGC